MIELVEALRRAVRAEIAAAIDAAGPVSNARHLASLAERMEVERCWAYAARVAHGLVEARAESEAHEASPRGPYGPP